MRLTSDFLTSALTRRVFNEGGFATIVRRGAAEAGAIFLIIRARDGSASLYGPASQTSYDESRPAERQFTLLTDDAEKVDARLGKEMRFDPDVWIVELELGKTGIEELVPLAR